MSEEQAEVMLEELDDVRGTRGDVRGTMGKVFIKMADYCWTLIRDCTEPSNS